MRLVVSPAGAREREQGGDGKVQGGGKPGNALQRGIAGTAFDIGNVGPVQARLRSEAVLRKTPAVTVIPIDAGQRAAARNLRATARRAAGRYRVTDSPVCVSLSSQVHIEKNDDAKNNARRFGLSQLLSCLQPFSRENMIVADLPM